MALVWNLSNRRGVFKSLLPPEKIREKVASISDSTQLCPRELLVSPSGVPTSCPGVPTPASTATPSSQLPETPSPHLGSALTCQDLPFDLPNPQIRTLKGQKEGGEVKLGSSGGTHGGNGPLLPPQLCPLIPRDSFSNILRVFLVKIIPSAFPCKDHVLWGGWEGA